MTDEEIIKEMAKALMRHFNAEGKDVGSVLFEPGARAAFAIARIRIREQCAEEAAPFLRVYRINEPISSGWPANKPLRDIIPGLWPTWGDLKRIAALRQPKANPND